MKKKKSKAGRKKLDDKKMRVVLFFNQSRINDAGGEDNFKQYIYKLDEAHQQQFG